MHARIQEFSSGLAGGSKPDWQEKSFDVFFFFMFFVSPQFILQEESIQRKLSFNDTFPIVHEGGRSNISRAVQLFPGGGSPIAYSNIVL